LKGADGLIPVKIFIESTIEQPGEEKEVIEQELDGRFQMKEEEWILRYTENEGKPDEVRTSVRSFPEKITIARQGPVSYRQTYAPGKTMESVVHTPAGKTEMEVTTLVYERDWSGKEGRIRFTFLLHMGSQDLGQYQLSLKWMEAGK
jgi:uncharacterized beta-barrel protein YwiB (DUF1934 family)